MSGFIYMVSRDERCAAARIEASGLAAKLPGGYQVREAASGPGPGAWWVIAASAADNFYRPAAQSWQSSREGEWWVGININERPGPEELARDKQLAGWATELGDGNKWTVPLARVFDGKNNLPLVFKFGCGSELITEAMEQYSWLWDAAGRIWDGELDGGGNESIAARLEVALRALAINYRIGIDEANMLELFNSSTLTAATEAIVDGPRVKQIAAAIAEKKTAAPSPTRDCGSPD